MYFCSPLVKGCGPSFEEIPLTQGCFCQVHLKLAQWYRIAHLSFSSVELITVYLIDLQKVPRDIYQFQFGEVKFHI